MIIIKRGVGLLVPLGLGLAIALVGCSDRNSDRAADAADTAQNRESASAEASAAAADDESQLSTVAEAKRDDEPASPIRAAFFYPWFPHAWNQRGVDPFTNYTPELGRYESSNPDTIREQLDLARDAHVDAFIASWWGQDHRTDQALPALLDTTVADGSPHAELRWSIYYEEEGQSDPTPDRIADDLSYLSTEYFDHPAYLRLDGVPAVFVWADGGDGPDMARRWAAAEELLGADVYVVLKVFSGFRDVADQPDSWHQYGPDNRYLQHGDHSAAVSPGFWEMGESARLERDVARFEADVARMNSADVLWQLITTWNEWGEGTAVEPAVEFGRAYIDVLVAHPPVKTSPARPTAVSDASTTPGSSSLEDPRLTEVGTISGAVTFTAAGDFGVQPGTDKSLDLMAQLGPRFVLILGDLSYTDVPTEAEWCSYVTSHLGSIPAQLVVGNHEDDDRLDGYIGEFTSCLPDRFDSVGTYGAEYYFDVDGLMRVIMIGAGNDVDGIDYDYSVGTRHHRWLASAIDGARDEGIAWVVVGMHKVCLTAGNKSCETGRDVIDLLIEKRVDLVLQGHDHSYQRSKQMTCVMVESFNESCVVDDGSDGDYQKGVGTIWTIVGTAGGGGLTGVEVTDPEFDYLAAWMGSNHAQGGRGFLSVSVSPTELTAEFVGSTTDYVDQFTISG